MFVRVNFFGGGYNDSYYSLVDTSGNMADKYYPFIPVIVKFLLFPFYIRVKSLTLQTDK